VSSDGEMVSEFNEIFIDVQNLAKSIETGTRKIWKSSRKIRSEYSEDSEESNQKILPEDLKKSSGRFAAIYK